MRDDALDRILAAGDKTYSRWIRIGRADDAANRQLLVDQSVHAIGNGVILRQSDENLGCRGASCDDHGSLERCSTFKRRGANSD
jgi:hypothetical protein